MANRLLAQVEAVLTKAGLQPTNKLLLGISGGRDSVVLAHLLVQAGWQLALAHVNYGLRASESEEDAAFVHAMAQEWGVQLHLHQVSEAAGPNVQAWARDIRYHWFSELCRKYQYDAVLTAHHQADQAETVLLALLKGRGNKAVQGMRAVDQQRIRPMLEVGSDEIAAYAHQHQLQWHDDSSNASDKYDRNFIRNQLAPLMEQRFAQWAPLIARQASQWQQWQAMLDAQCEQLAPSFIVAKDDDQHYWQLEALATLPYADLIITEFGRRYGGSQHEIEALPTLQQMQAGKRLSLGDWWVYRSQAGFELVKKAKLDFDRSAQLEITGPGMYHFADIKLHISTEASEDAEAFTVSDLELPLLLRYWQTGDKIQLQGLGGSKKLSDLLSERKTDQLSRARQLVLCDQRNLLWVIGLRRSSFAAQPKQDAPVWWIRIEYDRFT